MKYENVKNLSHQDFKRLSGVHLETFTEMVKVVGKSISETKKTGRPNKLCLEDQILMTLEYLKDYRTYFQIGQDFDLHETNVYRTIRKIENILIQADSFRLPGKKKLTQVDENLKVAVVDVSEHPIDRPKKNRKNIIVAKKKDIL
jgi:hypothetical protein